MTRTVAIDLFRDYAGVCRAALQAARCKTGKLATDGDVVRAYLNLQWKLVRPVPRAIARSLSLQCPSSLQAGLDEIERKIRFGEVLTPHLSEKALKKYDDALLNDWGIHHLHLSAVMGPKGFVTRSGPTLFAKFTDTTAYLIGIFDHGDPAAYTRQSMIQILHAEFPESIARYRLHGILATQQRLSDEQIGNLRKNSYSYTVTVDDGTVYFCPGLGSQSNGISTAVYAQAMGWKKHYDSISKSVIDDIEAMAAQVRAATGKELPEHSIFKKTPGPNGELAIREMTTGLTLDLKHYEDRARRGALVAPIGP